MNASSQCADISLEFNRHVVNLLDSLSALSELTGLSIHDLDETGLLQQALEALMSNQDMERCSIFRLDANGVLTNAAGLDWDDMLRDMFHAPAENGSDPRTRTQYRIGEGIMGRAAKTGRIEHCVSCLDDPRFKIFSSGAASVNGSLICVPIVCEAQVLAVLNVFYPERGFFNMWHERLLLLFCQVLGRLLLNHRYTHRLSTLVSDKTHEVMAANAQLREEAAQRQRAQEILAHQHEFLQSVINSVSEPIMVIGNDYRLLMRNQPAIQAAAEVDNDKPHYCYRISHQRDTPCDGAEHPCPLQLVLERKRPASVVHRHANADGELRLIELQAAPLRDKDGAVIGIVESARDITERQQMLDALQKSEEKFHQMFEGMNSGAVIYQVVGNGEDFIFNKVNRAAGEIDRIDPAALIGRSVQEAFPGIQQLGLLDVFRRVWRTGVAEHYPLAFYQDQRISGWRENFVFKSAAGDLVAIYEDVTERKRAEQELRIAATAFETKEGLFVTDVNGVILRINHAFTEVTGYSAAEAIGKTPEILRSGRHDASFYQQLWQTLKRNLFWDGEIWNRRKNGEIYPEWLTISAVSGDDGRISHYVGIFSDITNRKATEEQIHNLAFYDPLTELPNRRLLLDRFAQALLASARRQSYGAILFLDLDKFKQLNDTHGHEMGDLLLVEVARRLLSCVRGEDTAARLGGDEFVVMLEDLGQEEQAALARAGEVAGKIREALAAPYLLRQKNYCSAPSIGVCLFNGTGVTTQELLMRADKAMYQAKAAGGNTLCVFEADAMGIGD